MKNKTKLVFTTIAQRDATLKTYTPGTYFIDRKDPLIVWV